ncbi:MAG: TolC family protein [Balneola sp.]|nr:MAG: TolC family protein [Balneola sp.]
MNQTRKMKRSWVILLVGLFALQASLSHAQTAKTEFVQDFELTLDEAIEIAVANNPQVNRALLSVDDADELVKIAYSEIFPEITSSISYTRNMEIPVTFVPGEFFGGDPGTLIPVEFGTDNNWQGGFTVNQTLFRGETIVGLSSATVFKTVQDENLRATTQQVVTQTRVAYYQVLAALEQLRLQEIQIERLEQNLRENEAREEAGLVDSYATLSLRVQLSNQRPQQIEAAYAVNEAYRVLKITLGVPLQLDFEVKGDLNEYDILSTSAAGSDNDHIFRIDQMNAYTYENQQVDTAGLDYNRGDLRVLDATLDLRAKELTAVKSRFLPTLSATYNLQWSSAEPDAPNFFENSERFQTLGFNLSLPLFQGFERVADVQRVKIQQKDLQEQRRAAILNAQNEIISASEDLNRAFETAEGRKIALEQATEGYDRAQKRLENGLGSQLEVTDAEVQVRQAELNYALMVFEYLSAKATYDLATGRVPYVDIEF